MAGWFLSWHSTSPRSGHLGRGDFIFGKIVDTLSYCATKGRMLNHAILLMPALAAASIVNDALLTSVANIESNFDNSAVGRSGERGAFQFMPSSWAHANAIAGTDYSFDKAHNWYIARTMAKHYLTWLEKCMTDAGYKPSKIRLYMAYNMGLSGSLRYAFDPNHPELPRSKRRILERAAKMLQ